MVMAGQSGQRFELGVRSEWGKVPPCFRFDPKGEPRLRTDRGAISESEATRAGPPPDKQGKRLAAGGRWLSALRHRNYRLFFGAQLLSLPGTWMQLVAEGWLVYQLTGSALALGMIRFLHTIPVTLLSFYAGGFADRYDKRKLLVMTQAVSMGIAFILFGLTASDHVEIWHVGVLAVAMGLVNAFDIPTRQSFIVELVGKRDLMNAIALNSSVFNTSRILGPGLAGLIIASFGVSYCFLLNAISFMFVIVGYLALRLPSRDLSQNPVGKPMGMGETLQFVASKSSLRTLVGMVAITSLFGMSYTTLMPIFAEAIWQVGPRGLGALLSANGVGALLGAVTLAAFSHTGKGPWLVRIGSTGFALSMIAFSLCPRFAMAWVALLVAGWFMVLFFATTNTLVQSQAPDEFRGRIMGLYTVCFIGLVPFGAFLAGAVAKAGGAPLTVALGASLCLVASGVLWRGELILSEAGARSGSCGK